MGIPEPDDQLIARVCAGRLESFEMIVDRHLSHIRIFAAYHAPSSESVDAITRATFAFALENIHLFKEGTDLRGWLRAIALKLVGVEFQRAHADAVSRFEKKRLALSQRKEVNPYAPSKVEFVEASLIGLPDLLEKACKLRYWEHKSSDRIAVVLGRSATSVRLALFRLRQELRRRVRGEMKEAAHA